MLERWGITAEQAERGEVLALCLEEIDVSTLLLKITFFHFFFH